MLEYKQSVSKFVPVRIFDLSNTPVSGVAFGVVQASVMKADGTSVGVTVTAPDWLEITSGAFAGSGVYALKLPALVLDQTGLLTYAVASASNKVHIGAVKVVANEEVDTFARIGAPVLASVSADIAGISADVADISTDVGDISTDVAALSTGQTTILTAVNLLKKYEEGRWKIHTSGGDVGRLVIYDTDDVTPLLKFDLKDSAGSITVINPFERVPFP